MAASFNVTKERKPAPGRHGGKRAGAGRKPLSQQHAKLTGLALDKPNFGDVTTRRRQLQELVIGSDKDPLMVLINLATDTSQDARLRVEAAGIACRYVHPTLQQAQISMLHQKADPAGTWQVINSRLDRLASPEVVNAAPRMRLHAVHTDAATTDANDTEDLPQPSEEAA